MFASLLLNNVYANDMVKAQGLLNDDITIVYRSLLPKLVIRLQLATENIDMYFTFRMTWYFSKSVTAEF